MPGEIAYADREALVSILARWSEAGTPNGPAYFQNLVKQANFADRIKIKGTAGYVGDATYNARHLVDFAIAIGTNPKDKNAALGSILLPLIPEAGLEDATYIASLIVTYGLVQSKDEIGTLAARYQIPQRRIAAPLLGVAAAAPLVLGPPVQWAGETEKL